MAGRVVGEGESYNHCQSDLVDQKEAVHTMLSRPPHMDVQSEVLGACVHRNHSNEKHYPEEYQGATTVVMDSMVGAFFRTPALKGSLASRNQ